MNDVPFQDRTDSVPEKLRLLQAAYAAGNLDLAMSLAETAKETLLFESRSKPSGGEPRVSAAQFVAVAELPRPWSLWAAGWESCKSIQLFETVGIERVGEPVELTVAFRADQVADLARELRLARVDGGSLRQVPCQVDDYSRIGNERRCQLIFLADVPAHGDARYLLFFQNAFAERPDEMADLHVHGEDDGLEIENQHYLASLSRQMGQLERLVYKRQHGLELYAGGKGHGEPPGIDWAHDYVDAGHFQKLRMRNWPRCPNLEVVRGPLCVRVRRWGFPFSPLHPVFAPSRVHMDVRYDFYAGLPYFFKEGRIDVIKDVDIAAMRDDEWVFSGYSFTDTLWIDAQGKLREGPVPADQAEQLWGAGFFHRDSRDAFVALWLEHSAEGCREPTHGGVPTLNYPGHGQLWSRYPASQATLKAGASIRQRNAYVVLPYEGPNAAETLERLRHQLLNPLRVQSADVPRVAAASAAVPLARPGESKPTASLKPAIWKALAEVRDEQLYTAKASIVDLGYVLDVRERGGRVSILVTMPHRGRPVYDFLVSAGGGRVEPGIRECVLKVAGVREVNVECTWNPPWSVARLNDQGRRALGIPE
jgi:metal-sulfur cluster biosynthetic enzyme